jgi:Zn-dependent protease/CBS domain-containing protein
MAVAATLLLLGSILLHELGHAVVGRSRNLQVSVVTLYIFGGATSASDPTRPLDEFLFTVVGPAVNLLLALLLAGVTALADTGHLAAVAQVAGEAAWLNLLLGVFNLVPAAPLDGGHLLEAVVWRVTKSRPRAVQISATAGAMLGGGLIGLGLLELLLIRGGLFEGLWLALIGYTLLEGAHAEMTRAWVIQALTGKTARSLLTEHALAVTSDTSIGWLINAEFARHHVDAVPVEDRGETVGIVLAGDALAVPLRERTSATAGEIMRPVGSLPELEADADALQVLRRLGDEPLIVLLDRDGRVAGAVSQRQVGMALERLRLVEGGPSRRPGW